MIFQYFSKQIYFFKEFSRKPSKIKYFSSLCEPCVMIFILQITHYNITLLSYDPAYLLLWNRGLIKNFLLPLVTLLATFSDTNVKTVLDPASQVLFPPRVIGIFCTLRGGKFLKFLLVLQGFVNSIIYIGNSQNVYRNVPSNALYQNSEFSGDWTIPCILGSALMI